MDWLYLQTRMSVDPDLAPRTRRLLALEALLDGRQYDVLPFPFACERSGAGEYVPLSERRPSVRTGLCRVVVEDSVSLLFSEGHFPTFQAVDDATRTVLPALVRELRLNETMLEAATRGSVGSVAILFRVVDDRPFFDVLSSAFLWPEWAEHDRRQLRRVTERYKVEGRDLAARGYDTDPGRRYWFTRSWDAETETWFQPQPVDDVAGVPLPDPVRSVHHALGFVPIIWIRNLPGGPVDAIDGACTFSPAIDTVIETDYLLSQAGRGLKYGSDPTLVLKDGGHGDVAPRIGGASTALILPPEGDAKLLEINGNAASAVLAHVKELRAIALEAMHGNRAHGDRLGAPQSGRAMELMSQGLVWLADRLRISYGEGALLALVRMVCRASASSPNGLLIGGAYHANLSPDGLGLRWPDWFSPSFADRQAQANTLATLVGAGILSRETATAIVSAIYDVDDTEAERRRIEDEPSAMSHKQDQNEHDRN